MMGNLKQLGVALGLFASGLIAAAEPASSKDVRLRQGYGGLAAGTGKPNFVVIFTDDQVYRAIGYNNPEVKTPNLDSIANEGLIFNNAYVASPLCTPSRASMMSGVFPQQHGVIAFYKEGFKDFVKGGSKAELTLPNQLRKAGYHCAFWGKSHLGDPKNYGFQEGKETRGANDKLTFKLVDEFLARAAKDPQPFFLWIGVRQPHVPLLPEQKWLDLYDVADINLAPNFREKPLTESVFNQSGSREKTGYRDSKYTRNWKKLPAGPPRNADVMRDFTKAYYATISHLDDQIGQLMKQLKELKLDKNTVIVFLSDNGYHLGTHGLGNKITMHEESVRVPMFIHWEGLKAKGQRTDALTSSLDLYPTLLEIAGVELPPHLQGRSLVSVMNDSKAKVRDYVFSECIGGGGDPGEGHRMVRSEKWKYILTITDETLLFNQQKDPYELHDLANSPEHAPVVKRMQQELAEWMKGNNDRTPPFAK